MFLQRKLLQSNALDNNPALKKKMRATLEEHFNGALDNKGKNDKTTSVYLGTVYSGLKNNWPEIARTLKKAGRKNIKKEVMNKKNMCENQIIAIKTLLDTKEYSKAA